MANFYLFLDEEAKILRTIMKEIIVRIKNNMLRMAAENRIEMPYDIAELLK